MGCVCPPGNLLARSQMLPSQPLPKEEVTSANSQRAVGVPPQHHPYPETFHLPCAGDERKNYRAAEAGVLPSSTHFLCLQPPLLTTQRAAQGLKKQVCWDSPGLRGDTGGHFRGNISTSSPTPGGWYLGGQLRVASLTLRALVQVRCRGHLQLKQPWQA